MILIDLHYFLFIDFGRLLLIFALIYIDFHSVSEILNEFGLEAGMEQPFEYIYIYIYTCVCVCVRPRRLPPPYNGMVSLRC